MGRAVLVLANDYLRAKAKHWIDKAPHLTRVTFQGPRRTIPQNSRLWASLTDVSVQVKWHGLTLSPEDWKLIFLDALNRELRIVPNLDGTGFVNLGRSSSNLDVGEMSELLELMYAWGARNGVTFHDDADTAPGGLPADEEEATMSDGHDTQPETTENPPTHGFGNAPADTNGEDSAAGDAPEVGIGDEVQEEGDEPEDDGEE